MSEPAIVATRLCRRFPGGVGLEHLDVEVPTGTVLALLGPNGAGKTTTVRLLNGVLRPDGGTARVLGLDPTTEGTAVRRRTGVLTEHAGFDDRLTARENLKYGAQVRGLVGPETDARIDELLERFEMGERADRPVQGASTGQRKRLGLARALLHRPEVLFLDEPTSGLDPSATRAVVELIRGLATDEGRTVILCTHFLGEAGQLADQMAVLDRGRLVASGAPAELAATLWQGMAVDLSVDRPEAAEAVVRSCRGVLEVERTAGGITARVEAREVVAAVVRALVEAGVDVLGAVPREPTLEDVYFELEARASTEASVAS